MLLPALSKVKDKVETMSCTNMMKQRFSYYQLYINDFDYLPTHVYGEHHYNRANQTHGKMGNSGIMRLYGMPGTILTCSTWANHRKGVIHTEKSVKDEGDIGPWINPALGYYMANKESAPDRFYASYWSFIKASRITRPTIRIFLSHVMKNDEYDSIIAPIHENFSLATMLYLDGHYGTAPMPLARAWISYDPTHPPNHASYVVYAWTLTGKDSYQSTYHYRYFGFKGRYFGVYGTLTNWNCTETKK